MESIGEDGEGREGWVPRAWLIWRMVSLWICSQRAWYWARSEAATAVPLGCLVDSFLSMM